MNVENNDFKGAVPGYNETVKAIDIILNGSAASKQASLCDLIDEITELKHRHDILQDAVNDIAKQMTCQEIQNNEELPIDENGSRLGDVEMGYDCCVNRARQAIAKCNAIGSNSPGEPQTDTTTDTNEQGVWTPVDSNGNVVSKQI